MEDLEAVFKLKIIDGFVTAITFLTCIPEAIQLHPAPPEGGLRADGLLGCLAERSVSARLECAKRRLESALMRHCARLLRRLCEHRRRQAAYRLCMNSDFYGAWLFG